MMAARGSLTQQLGIKPRVRTITTSQQVQAPQYSQEQLTAMAQQEYEAAKQAKISDINQEIERYTALKNEAKARQTTTQSQEENRDADIRTYGMQINALLDARRQLYNQTISPEQVDAYVEARASKQVYSVPSTITIGGLQVEPDTVVFKDGQGYSVAPELQQQFLSKTPARTFSSTIGFDQFGNIQSRDTSIQTSAQDIFGASSSTITTSSYSMQPTQKRYSMAEDFERTGFTASITNIAKEFKQTGIIEGTSQMAKDLSTPFRQGYSFIVGSKPVKKAQEYGDILTAELETTRLKAVAPLKVFDLGGQEIESLEKEEQQRRKVLSKKIDEFNLQYGGKELGESEYGKALVAQTYITNEEYRLSNLTRRIEAKKKEKEFYPSTAFAALGVGVVSSPFSLAKLGVGLTRPVKTVKETAKGFYGLPAAFVSAPLTTTGTVAGEFLGQGGILKGFYSVKNYPIRISQPKPVPMVRAKSVILNVYDGERVTSLGGFAQSKVTAARYGYETTLGAEVKKFLTGKAPKGKDVSELKFGEYQKLYPLEKPKMIEKPEAVLSVKPISNIKQVGEIRTQKAVPGRKSPMIVSTFRGEMKPTGKTIGTVKESALDELTRSQLGEITSLKQYPKEFNVRLDLDKKTGIEIGGVETQDFLKVTSRGELRPISPGKRTRKGAITTIKESVISQETGMEFGITGKELFRERLGVTDVTYPAKFRKGKKFKEYPQKTSLITGETLVFDLKKVPKTEGVEFIQPAQIQKTKFTNRALAQLQTQQAAASLIQKNIRRQSPKWTKPNTRLSPQLNIGRSLYAGTGLYERTAETTSISPAMKELSITKPSMIYKESPRFISKEITKMQPKMIEKMMPKMIPRTLSKPIAKEITKMQPKQIEKLQSKQIEKLVPKQITKITPSIITPTTFITPRPRPRRIIPRARAKSPGRKQKDTFNISKMFKVKRTPSLVALGERIRATRTAPGEFSSLNIRPILIGRRRKGAKKKK